MYIGKFNQVYLQLFRRFVFGKSYSQNKNQVFNETQKSLKCILFLFFVFVHSLELISTVLCFA